MEKVEPPPGILLPVSGIAGYCLASINQLRSFHAEDKCVISPRFVNYVTITTVVSFSLKRRVHATINAAPQCLSTSSSSPGPPKPKVAARPANAISPTCRPRVERHNCQLGCSFTSPLYARHYRPSLPFRALSLRLGDDVRL